ncbi:hypothetical protein [Hydrocarboniphaga sp.]|uniref:hypothetical protein n=1 Tax=Hydrocarboniphaga sp. TaxID=2033016 RepID=UPI003D0FF405
MTEEDALRKERKRKRRARREARLAALSPPSPAGVARPQAVDAITAAAGPVETADVAVPRRERARPRQAALQPTRLADSSQPLLLTIAYGQSNAEAGGLRKLGRGRVMPVSDVVDEQRAMMLDTGLLGVQGRVLDGASLSDIVPARENPASGESGGCAFLRHSLASDDALGQPATVYLYRSAGQGGRLLADLSEGSQAFQNFLTTVDRSVAIARGYGRSLWVPHFLWDHGEEDRKRATDPECYRRDMVELRRRLDQQIRERTGQLQPVWMLTTILVAPARRNANTHSDITLAQVAALSEPGIAPVCSPYWFCGDYGFSEGQAVHWGPLAKALLREYGARAARIVREAVTRNPDIRLGMTIRRPVYDPGLDGGNGGWSLLEVPFETSPRTDPASIVRDGDRISGTVLYAERGLEIYIGDRGAAEHFGFEWTGSGHIIGVDVENQSSRSRWIVRLSSGSSGRLSYATTFQARVGPANAPQKWGNIFDRCAEPSLAMPGLVLRQGMLPFSVLIE